MNNSFSISPTLDKNKVFLLQKSELEKRLDPYFYLPKFIELEKRLKKLPTIKISEVATNIFSGSTPLSKGEAYTDKENGIPFVRSGDFNIDGSINFDDLVYLKSEIHSTQLKSSHLKNNDLLFAIVGATIGKVGVYKNSKEANINQAICAVRLKENFDVDYINAFFQTGIGQNLIDRIKRPVARANVNLDEIASLPIIIPKKEIQEKAISIFKKSLSQKKQNEAAAEKLLASIDDYLLKELGITLPILPKNNLKNRMFTRTMNEISGNRFDPHFHQDKFKQLYLNLHEGLFPISNLKKKSTLITSGATPLSKGEAYTEDSSIGIPFIRSGEIGDIDFETCIYITPEIHNSMLKSSHLKKGDLLIAIVGATIGEIGVYNFSREANINQAIALVRLNKEVMSEFAKEFFKGSIGKSILDRVKRPVARANINLDEIGTLPIPVPPLAKQKEIASHITEIRKQAQTLKDKTKEALKKASVDIEEILLGNETCK
jgi:restriction endonuclease S subunit